MDSDDSQLQIISKEKLPDKTHIYQTDDGTIFYFKPIPPARLYVKNEGNEINGSLPDGDLFCTGAHGNSIFLDVDEKEVHKAVFYPDTGLTVSYERDIVEKDTLAFDSVCIRQKDGDKYTYRLLDNHRDGNHIADRETVKRWRTQRGIDFYLSQTPHTTGLSVHSLSKTKVVIEAPDKRIVKNYSPNCNGVLLYLACGSEFTVLNTEAMDFLPWLNIEHIDYIADIVRVRDGIITLRTHHNEQFFAMTARLPEKYCEL